MTAEHPAQPRIFRVRYGGFRRRTRNGRWTTSSFDRWVKVPYSGLFGMVDTLTRATATSQISWFRIDVAKPGEITADVRGQLVRWSDALLYSTEVTGVDFSR